MTTAPEDPDWEIVSNQPFAIARVEDIQRDAVAAEKRRAVAASLLERLTSARDTIDALNPWPLVVFPRGDAGEPPAVPDPSPEERARREAEYRDLRDVLEALRPQLLVAERLLQRLHGPGQLLDAAALASLRPLYEGVDDPVVVALLARRPAIVPRLLAAPPFLRRHFGDAVTLHILPPARYEPRDETLSVVARGHGLSLEEVSARELALHADLDAATADTLPACNFVSFGVDLFAETPPLAP